VVFHLWTKIDELDMSIVQELVEKINAESATGCMGAGDYRQWAQEQGYKFCEVLDWTSSAGD